MTNAEVRKAGAGAGVRAPVIADRSRPEAGQSRATKASRYCRVRHASQIWTGRIRGEHIELFCEDIFALTSSRRAAPVAMIPLRGAALLAPVAPRTVLAVGNNYASPLGGGSVTHPVPGLYLKPPGAIIGHAQSISLPAGVGIVQVEGNMVVVIGRRGKHIAEADAPDHILGVTCGNDISERIWQRADLQWARAKGADGVGPLGPVIATGLEIGDLAIETRINGRVEQRGSTAFMLNSAAAIIAYISRTMTLEPGDVIFTGSPGNPPTIAPGDHVEVEIEGVGVLANWIRPQPRREGAARPA